LKIKKNNRKKERENSWLERERVRVVEIIEEGIKKKRIKTEDLGEYSNYEEQLSRLDKKSKIHSFRDSVEEFIRLQGNKQEDEKKKDIISQLESAKSEEEWERAKSILLVEIQRLSDLAKSGSEGQEKPARRIKDVEEFINQLLDEIFALEVEIQEIKKKRW